MIMATATFQAKATKLYSSRIDLPTENRTQIIALLNLALALTLDLKTQVKQAHWNVKGMNFYQLHQLFDQIAIDINSEQSNRQFKLITRSMEIWIYE
jgi:hypothetical protein